MPAAIMSGLFLNYIRINESMINLGLIQEKSSVVILKKGKKNKGDK